MVTDADLEAAKHIETLQYISGQYLPGGPRDIKGAIRAACSALDASRHRTASTAALTAEIQRLREAVTTIIGRCGALEDEAAGRLAAEDCGDYERPFMRGQNIIAKSLRRHLHDMTRTSLSTPSEVSEPVADDEAYRDAWSDFEGEHLTDGNDGWRPAAVIQACRAAFDATWPKGWEAANKAAFEALTASTHEPVADHIGGEGETPEPFGYWVEQKHAEPFGVLLRKPAYIPEPSPLRTVTPLYATTPNTNGDAVREALLGGCLGISGNTLTFDAGNRADVETVFEHLLATLAKHGGSEA